MTEGVVLRAQRGFAAAQQGGGGSECILKSDFWADFRFTALRRRSISSSAPRVRSLLAYLLLHADTSLPRARVAFVLWPDLTEAAARNNLRQTLHQLRGALPQIARFLHTDSETLQWSDAGDCRVDVREFERALSEAERSRPAERDWTNGLEEAVRWYAGELLPGCYDDWIAPLRGEAAGGERACAGAACGGLHWGAGSLRRASVCGKLAGVGWPAGCAQPCLDGNIRRNGRPGSGVRGLRTVCGGDAPGTGRRTCARGGAAGGAFACTGCRHTGPVTSRGCAGQVGWPAQRMAAAGA